MVTYYNIIPVGLQLKLFDPTIVSMLLHKCKLFGFENADELENFHCDFLITVLKYRKSTPRYMLYRELGGYTLSVIIKSHDLSF